MLERSVRLKLALFFFLSALAVASQLPFFQPKVAYSLSPGVAGGTRQSLGRSIDLYTQKEPYDGKGANQSSDAFAPQQEVILYAYVTYNEAPVMNKIVYFEVNGPVNPLYEVSLSRTATTDEEGLASVSFRIPWPAENAETVVFGTWTVVAAVEIAEETVADTLTFEVGWIIELVKVETVDVNNMSKTNFTRGEHMHFRLTVRNIALVEKIATLTIDVYDELDVLLGVVVRENVNIPPGVTVYFIEDLLIPTSAYVGVGVVRANAYDVFDAAWCPEVTTTFSIIMPIERDVAVINVVPSATEVSPCNVVNIMVVVKNEGDITETFDVSAYYDSALIGTLPVISLPSESERTLTFGWSTSCVPPGVYTISAVASPVPGEIDVADNTFIDGTVEIKPSHEPPVVSELPAWLVWLVAILIALAAASLTVSIVLLFYVRKRKRNSPTKVVDPVGFEGRKNKTCIECGRDFLDVRTFCPHCFAYNG